MREFAPNLLLFLLLLFLVPIYLMQRTTEVLTLSILLLAVAVFLAYTNRPRGLEMLAFMTAFVSILAIFIFGQTMAGTNGGYCFVFLWLLVLVLIVRMFRRRSVMVERGQIMVINQLLTNRLLVWEEGWHRPLNPLFERRLAALPGYVLNLDTTLEHLNTRSVYNVDQLRVLVRYFVEQPHEVVVNFPNREQAQTQLVRERGEPPANATAEQVAFWTELIHRQMRTEIDQSTRSVLAGIADLSKLVQARHEIDDRIGERLQQSVARWGITIEEVRLLEVGLDPEYQRMLERSAQNARTGETLPNPVLSSPATQQEPNGRPQEPAQRQAPATERFQHDPAEADQPNDNQTEQLVRDVMERLKAQGRSANTDEVERLVRKALEERSKTRSPERSNSEDAQFGLSN